MSFGFNTTVIKNDSIDLVGLLNAEESLHQAYCDLLDSQRQLAEVNEVMENIHTSINLITKYGQDGVKQLNVDGSLEQLLNVPAKMITAEKAQEGFGDVAADLWKKFKDLVAAIWDAIKRSVKFIIDKLVQFGGWVSSKIRVVNTATPEQWRAAGAIKVNTPVGTEALKDWYSMTTLYPAETILNLLKDYDEYLRIAKTSYQWFKGTDFIFYELIPILEKYKQSTDASLKVKFEDVVKNKMLPILKKFVTDITNTNTSVLKITCNYDPEKPNVIPADFVTISSTALSNYKPQETTYAALGWANETTGKKNLTEFLDKFGKSQVEFGELQRGIDMTSRVIDDGTDKVVKIVQSFLNDSHFVYTGITEIQNICKAMCKFGLKIGFEQHQVLLETAKELGPMFNKLTEK